MSLYDKVLQDDKLVAYGFLAELDEQARMMQNKYIQLFYTASDARKALACATSDVQVVVCSRSETALQDVMEVSPLNLAAALHRDNPLRDIYMEKTDPGALFVSRAEAAGARDVIATREAQGLLGAVPSTTKEAEDLLEVMPSTTKEAEDLLGAIPSTTKNRSTIPSNDFAWLEQALELEDLDELSGTPSSAVVEKPPTHQPDLTVHHEADTEQFTANEPEQQGDGIVAAFVSGRGGVGKSSLSVLSAMDLWKSGLKVALVDMDLQFGDISMLTGDEPECRIQRLEIEQLCENRMRIPALEESLLLVEAPRHPEAAEELVHRIPQLIAALRTVADIVLVNTACLWNEAAAVLASSVDKLIICMDQRATSISAARQVVALCIRLQIPSTHLYYLLNRSARNAPITDIDASLAMGGVDIITIAEGGVDVDELLSLGCPQELLRAQSALRQSIHELGALLATHPGAALGSTGGYR